MNKHNKHSFTSESNILDSEHSFSFSVFFEQVHSVNTLYLIAGLCQIFLGISVITVSVLGYIQELWLSSALTMLASISTVIGFYLMYVTVSKWRDPEALLHNAMKRVMESKN